jgi:hypothetical protein
MIERRNGHSIFQNLKKGYLLLKIIAKVWRNYLRQLSFSNERIHIPAIQHCVMAGG